MTKPARELEQILGQAGVTANVLSRRLRRMLQVIEDSRAGYSSNHAYDVPRTSGGRTVLYCDTHERELSDCLKAGESCEGSPIPMHSDPTGDAVAGGHDQASAHAREVEDLVLGIQSRVDRLHVLGEFYNPLRPLDARARKSLEHSTPDLCEIHHLAGGRFPAVGFTDLSEAPSAVRVMPEKRLVCRWCRDFATSTGDWPTVAQAEANALGKKVKRTAHILRHRAS